MANYKALPIKQGKQTLHDRLMKHQVMTLHFGQATALKEMALPAPTLKRTLYYYDVFRNVLSPNVDSSFCLQTAFC